MASGRVLITGPNVGMEGMISCAGGVDRSGPARGTTMLNLMTSPVDCGSATRNPPPPKGASGPRLSMVTLAPTLTREKSTITSARSAGPISNFSTRTGARRNPPSLPICHTSTIGSLKLRITNRELQPLRIRNRYRRGSTSRNGQVLPLTTMQFPKNSGFQIGDTSELGTNGPAKPSKNVRVFG